MEEQIKELDKYFFDKDGKFIPRTSSSGNVSGRLAHLRNVYMEAEHEYFLELLSNYYFDSDFLNTFIDFIYNTSSDGIFSYAEKYMKRLENGELETREDMEKKSPEDRDKVHMHNLETAEAMITLLFAAASDKVKILELLLQMKDELEKSYGPSLGM